MNKISYLLLISLIISNIYCDSECGRDDLAPNKVEDCTSLSVDAEFYKCCFLEYSGGKFCTEVTKAQYDEIDEYIDELEDGTGDDDVEIDCSSRYIIMSLLSLIILLL